MLAFRIDSPVGMEKHPNSLANLRPIQRGEVRNPSGRNQFTYRREFEAAIQRLAEGKYEGRTQPIDDASARCWYCQLPECQLQAAGIGPVHGECLTQVRGMTGAEALAHVGFRKGLAGDEKFWPELARRFWPATEKREHEASGSFGELLRGLSGAVSRGKTIDAELVNELLGENAP
jgi:hypothetical protein